MKFDIGGMSCAACSAHIERAVSKLDGVENVAVSLLTNSMTVEGKISPEEIVAAVERSGYTAKISDGTIKRTDESAAYKKRIIVSAVFLVVIMYFSMGHMFGAPIPHILHNVRYMGILQLVLTVPVVVINRSYFINGFKRLFTLAPNMDSLIAMGSTVGILYGLYVIATGEGHLYFESSAMILTLITVGKYLEANSRKKTGDAISALVALAPSVATVIRDGKELVIASEQIVKGDIFVVRAGDKLPVDGVVIDGNVSLDRSAITGESIPVLCGVGEGVTSATTVVSGYAKCEATKVGEDTTLAKIIELVSGASASKAPIGRLADKVSGIFVPVVMAIAVITFIVHMLISGNFENALTSAVAVLVISCPCSLGLATPVAISVGCGKAAANGILIKSAEALENIHRADAVVFDKTGTVTNGTPKVTYYSDENILKIAASLEKKSEHPFAGAILEAYKGETFKVENYQTIVGKGISGEINSKTYYIGNALLMSEMGIEIKDDADHDGTPLYVCDDKFLGTIYAADTVKQNAEKTVKALKEADVEVYMLTGDNAATALKIAKSVGIDNVFAEVLPGEKQDKIKLLQSESKHVIMVGDGINDAPALTQADVGVAIGAGTDIAIESADIVLTKSDPYDLYYALMLGRATIKNIKENLFWAFFYNTIGIPLAAFGVLNPMFGAAAMSLSSVCVVTNSLRLRLFKIKGDKTMEKVLKVNGMMCEHCSARVEKALMALDGVESVRVDLGAKTASVAMSKEVDTQILKKAVVDAGYEVE